ncbi:calcium-binding protein [Tateyamaria sp. SN3-11]|uniref:calcium-binding protein n=1 Tax=Tateyamaria sp. SN3-11 TaxID=3092147 RepID=UPI0039EC26A8
MLFLLSLFPALLAGSLSTESDSDADDVALTGTDGADSLVGGDGDDDLLGGLGADTIEGGAGNDLIQGQGGEDVLIGNEGNDAMQGRGQDDTVQGFSGNDWVDGNDGDDFVRGGAGNDVVIGGDGADAIFGRADDDLIIAGEVPGTPLSNAQLDQLRDGVSLEDVLSGDLISSFDLEDDGDADTVVGGGGDDLMIFGEGDTARGGNGEDGFAILAESAGGESGPAVIQDYTAEDDTIFVYFQSDDVPADSEITVADDGDDAVISLDGEELGRVTGAAGQLTADQIEVVQPIETPDVTEINGTDDADTLTGGGEDEQINGAGGDDDLLGGNGADTITGGAGADVIQGQGGFDRITGNADDDLIQGRGGDDTLSGNAGADWVDGNDGDDSVNGGTQNDTVVGGLGSDVLSGGEAQDVLVSGELLADPLTTGELDNIRDGETLAEATGIALGDTVFLDDDGAADTLDGGNASDVLFFGAGDTATGGNGPDDFGIIADSAGNGLGEALITDYTAGEDELFIVLDDLGAAAAPVVTVVDDGADAVISLGGEVLARVTGGAGVVTAAQIALTTGVSTSVFDPNA